MKLKHFIYLYYYIMLWYKGLHKFHNRAESNETKGRILLAGWGSPICDLKQYHKKIKPTFIGIGKI